MSATRAQEMPDGVTKRGQTTLSARRKLTDGADFLGEILEVFEEFLLAGPLLGSGVRGLRVRVLVSVRGGNDPRLATSS